MNLETTRIFLQVQNIYDHRKSRILCIGEWVLIPKNTENKPETCLLFHFWIIINVLHDPQTTCKFDSHRFYSFDFWQFDVCVI